MTGEHVPGDEGHVGKSQSAHVDPADRAAAEARGGWVETEALAALVLARCRLARGDADAADGLHELALALAAEVGLPGVQRAAGGAVPHA